MEKMFWQALTKYVLPLLKINSVENNMEDTEDSSFD